MLSFHRKMLGRREIVIDLHTHILPGLDDGSRDIQQSLAMAQVAYNDGIHTIVATPHVLKGVFANSRDKILSAVALLNQTLKEHNIKVNILPGAEYYLEPDLALSLAQGKLLTLNDKGRYLLVELPSAFIPEYTAQVLYEIQLQGVTPIIAHPERNASVAARPALLQEMVAKGALVQITSASIIGLFGKRVKKTAFSFLKQGLAHLIASDAHRENGRAPMLTPAAQQIKQHFDSSIAELLVIQNPALIIKGEPVQTLCIPNHHKRWNFFGQKVLLPFNYSKNNISKKSRNLVTIVELITKIILY